MNQIAALLDADRIVLDLAVDGKAGLFDAVGVLFERAAGLSGAAVAHSLATREKLGSTGIGQGIAIPHGRIRKLPEATDDVEVIAQTAFDLYLALADDRPVRLLGVRGEMVPPEGGY
jgi:mannitol/fructose-specific phosphotransferase system IIA component (Ntr-type)